MPSFKQMPMTSGQVFMFPVSVEESIPGDCDVRILGEGMDLLDWSAFESGYLETGCPAYPPKVLAKILVYGYSKGIRSSRALEDAARHDTRYMWLTGGLKPDHSTIARFRKDKQEELRAAYKGSVKICAEARLILLNVTATDGSTETWIACIVHNLRIYGKRKRKPLVSALSWVLSRLIGLVGGPAGSMNRNLIPLPLGIQA